MRTFLYGTAVFAVMVVPAAAETRYDRNLEKAAAGIVAGKMGDIRGGFSYKQVPQLVPDAAPVPAVPVEHSREQASGNADDGLSPAVERQVPRATF
ncbi:hypothetical protein LB561_17030 [Mesorhizobium sp. B292B1B]|uniref:hypothetical protein n=1 Tax=unclassified Mesorhizobium TaxID=325217 RepID=UPI00112EE7CF|nr:MULTISPECIES: hypothetical protein [unclassified Mesorhizobium]MCA0012445.1 hypothetical protein [Mesorhizobium sp. B294B1A1]MCA0038973.1 hypothetical protein [Mesorhizobium sp. B292B1B]TPM45811.1 hypothetical protein FJ964_14755 [Mesorhizobium sp. B2-3-2]